MWFEIKKNFKLHKQFMLRSYVCGLAFLLIRLLPLITEYTGIFSLMKNDEVQFKVYEWICWVYPLMLTEFISVWWPSFLKIRASKR